jgi:hypothetical protein
MQHNPYKLWIPVFALGWLFDLLFWDKALGINFAVFWTVCLGVALYLLLSEGIRPQRSSLALIPIFLFFAAITFLRAEPMTVFLAVLFSMFTLALLAVTYQGGRWFQYSLADYLLKYLSLAWSMAYRPGASIAAGQKARAKSSIKPQRANIMPFVRGVLIALPVVAVFAILLASADAVFKQKLGSLFSIFDIDNFDEYLLRFFIILIVGHALAGVVLHALSASKDEKLIGQEKPFQAFFGFIEAVIVLGSVVLLFGSFVIVQFQYFFGGSANINIEGFTYSEYARRGFGELIAVAFFALLMLLTLSTATKRETEKQRTIFTGLGVALVGLLLVILFSAYQRLSLYETVYGFSRLRTYTHVFLVWIGLLLIATIVLEILRKTRAFSLAMLIASLGFAMSLPILNVDGFIVRQNIQRELQGGAITNLDAQYFNELSADAVPSLVAALRDPKLPAPVHERIGAALACFQYQNNLNTRGLSWQSFHFANLAANNAMATVSQELAGYRFLEADVPPKSTVGPSGQVHSCLPANSD